MANDRMFAFSRSIDLEKAKEWIGKGAQPSDRIKIFLSTMGVGEKLIITEKTKKHLPKKKEEKPQEGAQAAKEEKPAEEKPKEEAKEKKEE